MLVYQARAWGPPLTTCSASYLPRMRQFWWQKVANQSRNVCFGCSGLFGALSILGVMINFETQQHTRPKLCSERGNNLVPKFLFFKKIINDWSQFPKHWLELSGSVRATKPGVEVQVPQNRQRAPWWVSMSLSRAPKFPNTPVAKFRITRNGNTSCGGILLLGDSTKPSLDFKPLAGGMWH